MSRFTSVEARIDAAAHRVLDRMPASGFSGALVEFVVFGLKQAWACLFGGALLFLIVATRYLWPADAVLTRYDFLFLAALALQAFLLLARLETWREASVILIFHAVGTAMELFKTSVGSWAYPEASLFHIGAVPLFSGFMYASVGSYLARVSRIFDMRYTAYPPLWATMLLAGAIYSNFFAHQPVVLVEGEAAGRHRAEQRAHDRHPQCHAGDFDTRGRHHPQRGDNAQDRDDGGFQQDLCHAPHLRGKHEMPVQPILIILSSCKNALDHGHAVTQLTPIRY